MISGEGTVYRLVAGAVLTAAAFTAMTGDFETAAGVLILYAAVLAMQEGLIGVVQKYAGKRRNRQTGRAGAQARIYTLRKEDARCARNVCGMFATVDAPTLRSRGRYTDADAAGKGSMRA